MGIIKRRGTMYLAKDMRKTSDKYRKGYDAINWNKPEPEKDSDDNKEKENN